MKLSAQKIYKHFDQCLDDCGVDIGVHCHYRNLSVTKIIREDHLENVNQYHTWHAMKALTMAMDAVASATKCKHNITWHREVEDEGESVKTHAHWCTRNGDGDADQLKTFFFWT